MIKDEELAELSDDPEWAFVEYEHLVRQRTAVALAVSPTQDHDRPRINYMRHVLAAVGSFKLGILGGWSVPQVGEGSISSKYEQFQSEVDYAVLQIRPRHARRVKRYSVALDPKAKSLSDIICNRLKTLSTDWTLQKGNGTGSTPGSLPSKLRSVAIAPHTTLSWRSSLRVPLTPVRWRTIWSQ